MRLPLFFILLLLSGYSCRKEIVVDNSDKNFPLTLSVTQSKEVTRFNWEEANVSDFERYVLVRSATPIDIGGTPFSSGKIVVFEGKDPKTTSFENGDISFDSVGYYKLFLQIGGRWLESNQVSVNNDAVVIEGSYFASYFLPDSNWVVLLVVEQASGLGRIILLDYAHNKKVFSTFDFPLITPEEIGVEIAYTNNKPELWLWSSSGYVQASLPDLTLIRNSNIANVSQFAFASGGGGIFLTTQNSVSSGFNVRKKSNLAILKSHTRQNYFEHRSLVVLDTNSNTIVEVSPFKLNLFTVNASTGAINTTGQISKGTNAFSPISVDIPVSPDRQFFCPYTDGDIYDSSLNLVLGSTPSTQSFIDLCFSKDGQFIYVLTFDNSTSVSTLIHKIRFPGGQIEKTIKLSSIPRRISCTEGGVVAVLANNTFPNFGMSIKKIAF